MKSSLELSASCWRRLLFGVALVISLAYGASTRAAQVTDGRVTVSMYPTGTYQVSSSITGWTFIGTLPNQLTALTSTSGTDSVGAYQQVSFSWLDVLGRSMTGTINLYTNQDTVVFSDTLVLSQSTNTATPSPFPNFTTLPQGLSSFSYNAGAGSAGDFSSPDFGLSVGPTPWMLFDSHANAVIISPGSHFVPSSMIGDGKFQLASGFNSSMTLADLTPTTSTGTNSFTQKTVMSVSAGINHTFSLWGLALSNLYAKARPAYDADTLLRYYGIWCDNGASYYYSYNSSATETGANAYETPYEATLQNLVANFQSAPNNIPVHYMQLDSWWYDKSNVSYNGGNAGGYHGGVPAQPWALFGGALSWAGDGYLFPPSGSTSGVLAFSQSLGMPFVCHGRWIDTTSTETGNSSPNDPTFYTQFGDTYAGNFSGIAGISSTFWNSLAAYAKANNIGFFEQDWLEEITTYSPAFTSTPDVGDEFYQNMAASFASQGVDIQYCIPLSSSILEGSEFANVTTTRASGDRFQSSRYHDFLYVSRFATSLGIWPWTDVFLSTELPNLLLSNLSAGPVGTGDYQGNESAADLFLAIRGDGVIVKPDSPLVPTDGAFLTESASGQNTGVPLVASTSTNNGVTTTYAVAIPQSSSSTSNFTFSPTDLGVTLPAYFYNYEAGTATEVTAGQTLAGTVPSSGSYSGVAYYVIAPVGKSGIAFLGDMGKYVSNGRKRIASVTDQTGQLTADVRFAPTETSIVLHGYSSLPPVATAQGGTASLVTYTAGTGHFTCTISSPTGSLTTTPTDQDPARDVIVTFTAVSTGVVAKALPDVTVAAASPTLVAGSDDVAKIVLDLSKPAVRELIVHYSVKGTAVNGIDYVLLSGTAKFKPGQTSKELTITPRDKADYDATKTVKLTLEEGADYKLGKKTSVKVNIRFGS